MAWHEAVPVVGRRAVGFELEHEARNSDSFYDRDAADMNAARLAHLDTLGIDWEGRRVLDVGSGPGLLAEHLVARGARVTCVDGRADLLDEARARVPSIETYVADVQRDPLLPIGRFDVVFAYGLLYHLAEPLRAIRNFVAVCDELLVLETITLDHPLPLVELVDEPAQANQAVDGLACRPTPSWIALALERTGMGMVYGTTTEPGYRDFGAPALGDLRWQRDGANLRRVFVAARAPVALPRLAPLADGERRSPVQIVIAVGDVATAEAVASARRDPTVIAYCLCRDEAAAEVLNGRLPNVHAARLDADAGGLGSFCDALRIDRAARVLLDDEPDGLLTVAAALDSLGSRLERVDEVAVHARGAGLAPVGVEVATLLEKAGLEPWAADDRGRAAPAVRFRRPGTALVSRALGWDGARAADNASAEISGSKLDVVTPPEPWSYGVVVPLHDDVSPEDVTVRVTLQVLEGRIGLALMRSIDELSLELPLDASAAEQVIDLPFAVVADAHDLLVRNHALAGAARCRLIKLELLGV